MFSVFFFIDASTTDIYTLSLHDALPILSLNVAEIETDLLARGRPHHTTGAAIKAVGGLPEDHRVPAQCGIGHVECIVVDRKSTRLNSSHRCISYAVFCLKKKKKKKK